MVVSTIKLTPSWQQYLAAEFEQPYMQQLKEFLIQEKNQKKVIYPKGNEIFQAFNLTPYEKIKVVIVGQDPYHGAGQAHGLCFSVKPGIKLPPSLVNIYKELEEDLGIKPVKHGYLIHWAEQGVLLLNSVLTVEHGLAASHQNRGWELFTDATIKALNLRQDPIIFLLWGNYAQRKGQNIDLSKHKIFSAAHPSPFSAYKGFFGTKPFSQVNQQLALWGKTPIDWQLPEL